ncbi:hypothetical protein EI200_25175 [Peribacillus simplex]|uniref:hypothetical protein n=1 Tax=Peribacillus simplex TaxID=1478 RepID=UPI000F631996|nr:hypothetical protein [Peribacillus simplex]RRN66747.1 hypothetical protein EI200_25175 [Peribacillus simplex]
MEIKSIQRLYIFFGLLFLANTALLVTVSISGRGSLKGYEFVMFGISIMTFCIAYIYPQFKDNDERSKRIKEKGMFFSYFFILGYSIILMGLFQFKVIHLNGYQTICLVVSLIIMTVFLSFVVLSKRY